MVINFIDTDGGIPCRNSLRSFLYMENHMFDVRVGQSNGSMSRQFNVSLPSMPSVKFLFCLICLLNVLDVILSLELVATFADELNPIIAVLMNKYGRIPTFFGYKVFFLTLLGVGVFSIKKVSLLSHRLLFFLAVIYWLLVSYIIGLTISA